MSQEPGDDPPPYRDPAGLHGRLLTSRTVWYDAQRAGAAFGLGGLYTHLDLRDGQAFPLRLDRVFAYFQVWGDPGEYRLRVRVVRIEATDSGEEVEVQLGADGEPREYLLPVRRPVTISGLNYVEEYAYPIGPVPFPEAGLYEYQLWAEGFDEPITRERILARE